MKRFEPHIVAAILLGALLAAVLESPRFMVKNETIYNDRFLQHGRVREWPTMERTR